MPGNRISLTAGFQVPKTFKAIILYAIFLVKTIIEPYLVRDSSYLSVILFIYK